MNHIFKTSVLIMECVELNWLSKHVKKIRSSQPDIPVLNWVKHQSFPVSIVKLWRPSSQDKVLSTNLTGGEPRFCTVDTSSSPQNNLILTLRYLHQSFRCHVIALITEKRPPKKLKTLFFLEPFISKTKIVDNFSIIFPSLKYFG